MIKCLIYLLIYFFASASSFYGQSLMNIHQIQDTEYFNLLGNVKELRCSEYLFEKTFFMVKKKQYGEPVLYEFDRNNRLIKRKIGVSVWIYRYDGLKIMETELYSNKEQKSKGIYYYESDKLVKKITLSYLNFKDSLNIDTIQVNRYHYSETSIKEETSSRNGEQLRIDSLNNDGLVLKTLVYSHDTLCDIIVYKYDSLGSLIQTEKTSVDDSFYLKKIFNSKSKLITETRRNSSCDSQTIKRFKYDDYGNLVEISGSKVSRYEYKYDEYNNWTERIEYNTNSPVGVVLREIDYW